QRLQHGVAAGDLVAPGGLAGPLAASAAARPATGGTALVRLVGGAVLGLRRRPAALERSTAHTAGSDGRALLALAHRSAARAVPCHRRLLSPAQSRVSRVHRAPSCPSSMRIPAAVSASRSASARAQSFSARAASRAASWLEISASSAACSAPETPWSCPHCAPSGSSP